METTSNTNVDVAKAAVSVDHPFLSMFGMLIGGFVGMLSETSLNIALPNLMTSFNVSVGTVQWLVTGYMLIIGIVLPLSSLLTRWFTTRQLIIFALLDFTVGAVISALAPNFAILMIGRMIQGIGTGIILPLMFTVATLIYPPYKLGAAMGMIGLVIMFAPAVGPTLSGIILGALNWHWIFWIFIPFLLVGLVFAIKFLPNVSELTHPKVDKLSILLSTLGFGGLVVAVSSASNYGWTSPIVLGLLIVAVIIIVFYVRRQIHTEVPILNFRVFSRRNFTTGAILVMLDFGIILASMYLLPMFWQKGLAISVALTGIVMLPGGLVNAIVSALSGRLTEQFSTKLLAVTGFALVIVGVLMLIFASDEASTIYVIAAHVILMIGAPLAMSPTQTFALNALDRETSSDGSTIMNTEQQIVGAISTAIATSLLAFGEASSHSSSARIAFTNGAHLGFIFPLCFAIIALLISLTIKDKRTN
ncbi:DHA2 family efflux MFS transporter permease subunit [Paucilactobacillus suebicus]|uniref:EmrB QacA subfamily drug resistance transporter n=1 Tax=Paucilactobacillus suebicus DSM 5007 = KCTC 3549 TaxID=1423807 RepID=A0A0R1W6W0_9LACO|nr:DHA2 family efflux MFS transporter permease subunit [Paucilactobacillus suebicus]KRM13415.1 EmrB QacA subfamily drug resistance transporter [Paucilactobacillus suebicus DSM 5007 = KCTC 3549]